MKEGNIKLNISVRDILLSLSEKALLKFLVSACLSNLSIRVSRRLTVSAVFLATVCVSILSSAIPLSPVRATVSVYNFKSLGDKLAPKPLATALILDKSALVLSAAYIFCAIPVLFTSNSFTFLANFAYSGFSKSSLSCTLSFLLSETPKSIWARDLFLPFNTPDVSVSKLNLEDVTARFSLVARVLASIVLVKSTNAARYCITT